MIGARRGVRNDRPVVPAFGVKRAGLGDHVSQRGGTSPYRRAIIDVDAKWRDILRA